MDTLPEAPPSYEQVIKRNLVQCGLSAVGVNVSYENELQSYEIVIARSANATPEMFRCVDNAAEAQIVKFQDHDLSGEYLRFLAERHRPEIQKRAETELASRGLLERFPQRTDFGNDTLFAEALEKHCGLAKGEAIRPFGDALAFQPPAEALRDLKSLERYSCLISAIQLVSAKGELTIKLIGNEALASPK